MSSTCGLVVSAPRHSGWSSGIEPRPSTVVTTGAPSRSASAVSAGPAPELTTPPPAHSTGRVAARERFRDLGQCLGVGGVTGLRSEDWDLYLGAAVLLVDRDLHRARLWPARADVLRRGDDGPADVLGAAHRLHPAA